MPITNASEFTRLKRLTADATGAKTTSKPRNKIPHGIFSTRGLVTNFLSTNTFTQKYGLSIVVLVNAIISIANTINAQIQSAALLGQAVTSGIITQGSSNNAAQYLLNGGSATNIDFAIILTGGGP